MVESTSTSLRPVFFALLGDVSTTAEAPSPIAAHMSSLSGDTIILAPPFVASDDEVREMVEVVRAVVGAL